MISLNGARSGPAISTMPPSRRRERHIGNDGSNVVRRDGLEQAGREPDQVSIHTCSGDGTENSRNWVARMML